MFHINTNCVPNLNQIHNLKLNKIYKLYNFDFQILYLKNTKIPQKMYQQFEQNSQLKLLNEIYKLYNFDFQILYKLFLDVLNIVSWESERNFVIDHWLNANYLSSIIISKCWKQEQFPRVVYFYIKC
jgi:hypothetical protein